MVPVIGASVVLVAVNAGTVPVPLAPRPIAVLEFVQLKIAPAGVLVKDVAGMSVPAQTDTGAGAVIVGTGFTVTVPVAVPVHPDKV
jgi:hypothetical protein